MLVLYLRSKQKMSMDPLPTDSQEFLLFVSFHFSQSISEKRIQQLCPNSNVKRPAFLAKALEARLYASCSSLEEYSNLSTLERRLRDVSMVAGRSIERARSIRKK